MPTGRPVHVLTLEPAVEEALSEPLVAASIWTMIGVMGFALLLFAYMGRNLRDPRITLIWVATLGIPAVSISSYFGLATGLTVGLVEHPSHGEIVTMWGRYLTWTFSTPLILIALGLLAGSNATKLFTAIIFDVAMCLTGLAAALTTSAVWMRWAWFALSSSFFLVVVYILLVEWPKDVRRQDEDVQNLFGVLKWLTVVLWFGYPLVWAVGTEGLALFGTGLSGLAFTSWGYSVLDIGAKFVFAFLLLRFLADEPRSVVGSPEWLGSTPARTDD